VSRKTQRVDRRRRLWEKDPRCRKCGRVTVLPETLWERDPDCPHKVRYPNGIPDNLATIQHHDSRLSGLRGCFDGEERTTLFCWACNQQDNDLVQEAAPKENLWERSGNVPVENMPHGEGWTREMLVTAWSALK